MKIQKEILISVFFVVALMSGITYLTYTNGKKSVASADNISRIRLILTALREIDEKDQALESNLHKYIISEGTWFSDSCKILPGQILDEISNIKIFGGDDKEMLDGTVTLENAINRQQQIVSKILELPKDSIAAAKQIVNSDSVHEVFYKVREEINKARENEGFLFSMQITINQGSSRNNLRLIFIRSGVILFFLLLGLFMINRDIRKRINAEKNALEREHKYSALIEGAGDLVCTFDYRGNLTYTSSRIETLSGYHREELLNKHYSTIIAPEWRDRVQQIFKEQLRNKKRETLAELQIITKKGEIRWVEIKAVLVSGNAETAGMLCICRDINVRKKAELDRANASRNQEIFLANMSHEIRTPMNGIIGLAHLLSITGLNTEQNDYLKGIRDSARKLLTIINDILDISKINAGKIVLEEEPFSIKELIDNTLLTLGRKAKKKNIKITTYIDPEIPRLVMGDHVRLSQILWNLGGNAVEYTERDGEVNILIVKQNEDENKTQVVFIVKDNGIGIESTLLPSIFEPFIQANPATSRKYGTGLGLSITKKLVEIQGGTISVQSTLGEGSQFSIHLSFRKYAYDKPKLEAINKHYGADYKNLNGVSVLLVEDNIINQKVGVKILEKKGIKVDVAENGKRAIEILEKKPYDLILMDLQMPEMNGFEATTYLRTKMTLNHQHIPVIAITAAALQGEYEKCMATGMNDYLLKPFEPNDLFDKMEHLLNLTPNPITS
ncbi:MAG TPA: response regulator [Bacteroidia bacterium]|nr:response regulator [Bacteroidia bacterium]